MKKVTVRIQPDSAAALKEMGERFIGRMEERANPIKTCGNSSLPKPFPRWTKRLIPESSSCQRFFSLQGLSLRVAAESLGVSYQQLDGLVNRQEALTDDMASRLAVVFGPDERFWRDLQNRYLSRAASVSLTTIG